MCDESFSVRVNNSRPHGANGTKCEYRAKDVWGVVAVLRKGVPVDAAVTGLYVTMLS